MLMLFIIGMAAIASALWQELTIYMSALQEDPDAIFYIIVTVVKLIGIVMIAIYGWPRA